MLLNNQMENSILEEIKDESNEQFPSVSEQNEVPQSFLNKNGNDSVPPIMSSLDKYEKPVEENKK